MVRLIGHLVHLDLVDVGDRATFAFAATATTGTSTVDGFGRRFVDMVVFLTKGKPLDLLLLFRSAPQG